MRRKELEVMERERLDEVLKAAEIGYLAFNGPDGWPRITPINFFYDGRILWHGAVAGERYECLKKDPRATFSAVSIQRYVPSHFSSEEDATAATEVFKSVHIRGRCQTIDDPEEKCAILNQLMDKYQPEGRYKRITPQDPLYSKVLKATGGYVLIPEEMTGKFKFAQGKSEAVRGKMIAKLKERGSPADRLIAEEILRTLSSSE
jgi:nitroimidazol reductase NimA-like FMN-containing flavoprotein (pyridoxamine 5'-phosphate oxidase superfamily)